MDVEIGEYSGAAPTIPAYLVLVWYGSTVQRWQIPWSRTAKDEEEAKAIAARLKNPEDGEYRWIHYDVRVVRLSTTDTDTRDAQRYRALRDSGHYSASVLSGYGWGLHCGGVKDSADDLDAAADALIDKVDEDEAQAMNDLRP
jgi:hypothetical protein